MPYDTTCHASAYTPTCTCALPSRETPLYSPTCIFTCVPAQTDMPSLSITARQACAYCIPTISEGSTLRDQIYSSCWPIILEPGWTVHRVGILVHLIAGRGETSRHPRKAGESVSPPYHVITNITCKSMRCRCSDGHM
jgi:hypothetical protein